MRPSPRRKDIDASGGLFLASGKTLLMARALSRKHEPTSAELKLARRLAQEGAGWTQIQAALGWNCCIETTKNRLKKFNIFSRVGQNTGRWRASKFGENTTIGRGAADSKYDTRVWKPRMVAP